MIFGVRISFVAAILVASSASAQSLTSRCDRQGTAAFENDVWKVDVDVANRLNTNLVSLTLDAADMENLIEQQLVNLGRHGRFQFQTRVLRGTGQCSIDDLETTACVEAFTNAEHDTCFNGASAFGGCTVYGCRLGICQQNLLPYADGQLDQILSHELGHVYSLSHPDAGEPPFIACTDADVQAPNEFCTTSDGCDGEMMCSVAQCSQSAFMASGDWAGFRDNYGTGNRGIRTAHDQLANGLGNPAWAAIAFPGISSFARWAPRIACTADSTPVLACAIAYLSSDTSLNVMGLGDPLTSGGWGTIVPRVASANEFMPPDIAMNASGSAAMVTRVDKESNLSVHRFALTSSTNTVLEITNGRPVLPPRIAFAAGAYWVLFLERRAGTSGSFINPDWELARIAADGSSFTDMSFSPGTGGVDLQGSDTDVRGVATDFDFDCITVNSTTARCTIVALLREDVERPVARPRSIRFQATTTSSTATVVDSAWDVGTHDTNGIVGATFGPAAVILTSLSRPITSSTTDNTRIARHLSERLSDGVFDTVLDGSDATSCTSTSSHGQTVGVNTHHGGYSVAWCPSCGGAEGTLESISWSAPNDGFCY